MAKPTRYNIKGRLAMLGLSNRDMVAELNKNGVKCSEVEFSQAINGGTQPKQDLICDTANQLLSTKEKHK